MLVWFVGKPVSEGSTTTEIGYVVKDTAAEKAGLKPGDKIKFIDGKPVRSFGGLVDSVRWLVVASEGENIEFTIERDGAHPRHHRSRPRSRNWSRTSRGGNPLFTRPAASAKLASSVANRPWSAA